MKSKNVWGILAGIAVALVALVVLAQGVLAQGPSANPERGLNQANGDGIPQWHRPGPGRGGPEGAPISVVADALGMTPQEVVTAMQDGKTLADIINENGGDLDSIVDEIIAPRVERINQLVENGYLDEQYVESLTAHARAEVTERMNQTWQQPAARIGGRFGDKADHPMAIIATTLGMTTTELLTELQAGKTVADVADEQNVALDDVVDAVVAPFEERMQTMVDSGRLTQEQADARIETMRENTTERMQLTWTPPVPGDRFDGGRGGHRGGGFPGMGDGPCMP